MTRLRSSNETVILCRHRDLWRISPAINVIQAIKGSGTFPVELSVPDALYYRQQAERFTRVAEQCSISELAPYYRKLAFDCLAQAVRAEAASTKAAEKTATRRRRRASLSQQARDAPA
jgi:hypothetical protein